jgi:hypothetical protein
VKFSDDMLFAHPVLSSRSNDFRDSLFETEFTVSLGERNWIELKAAVNLKCPDVHALLEQGSAGCGFYLICRETYQNRLIEMSPGTQDHKFNADQFFGTIQLRPVVWSKEARSGWKSDFLHPEYGGSVDLPAAAIIAVGDEQRFSVDRDRLKPFESIFSLAAADNLVRGQIAVDPDGDRITLFVHPETKDSIDAIRNDQRGRTVLLNAVYLPAIMQVLYELGQNPIGFEDRAWYRIFVAKCAACGVDPANSDFLRDAQRLLSYPFERVEAQKERLFA